MRKKPIMSVQGKFLNAVLLGFFGLTVQAVYGSSEEVIHSIDFSRQPESDATNWLRKQGFNFKLDADELIGGVIERG